MNKKNRNWQDNVRKENNALNLENWHRENAYNEDQWRKNNEYNEGMWNKQNEYNQKLWNQQNEYDSPTQQMERFRAAGLNPNLIYGQMSNGGGISTAQAEMSSPNKAGGTARAESNQYEGKQNVNFDLVSGIMAGIELDNKQAQTNNLEALNKVYEEDANLRAVQVAETGTRIAGMQTDNRLKTELYQTSVDAAKESLRSVKTQTDISLQRNEREAALNASNLSEAAERIATMRQGRITEQQKQNLNELDLNLKRMGVQPGDAMFFRVLGQFLQTNPVGQQMKSNIKSHFPSQNGFTQGPDGTIYWPKKGK